MPKIISPIHRDPNTIVYVDESTSGTTYVGKAKLGTATSSSGWQIRKIVVSSGITSVLYANGSYAYDQIWDNRASLSYS